LKVHQLNDVGIGALVNVKFKRERVNVPPIYFLSSDIESIQGVIDDYSNPKEPQYANQVHLFICSSLTDECMKLLKTSNLRRNIKTFQEVYCDYHSLESHVFHFNRPNAFHDLYLRDNCENELEATVANLFNLCVSLEENPIIRFSRDSALGSACAQMFHDFMSKKMQELDLKPKKKRATLLIIDRSQDSVVPLLHEITYQAMIKDLLPSETKYLPLEKSGGEDAAKDVAVSKFYFDDDPLWVGFRHKNLPNVLKDLQHKFEEFKNTNRIAKQQVGDNEQKDIEICP